MTWFPVDGLAPQSTVSGEQANGYVLKFYEAGTLTPLAVATDNTGGTLTTEFVYDTEGYPTVSDNIVCPHVETVYKVALYKNQTDADNDNTANAAYVLDNQDVGTPSGSIAVTDIEKLSPGNIIIGQTLNNAQVAISGDAKISELGALTIADKAVTEKKLSDEAQAKLNSAVSLSGSPQGLYISNNSTNPSTDIDVGVGYTADQLRTTLISLSSAGITQINNPIGTGDGGFPSSLTLTNGTWYHVFIVSESDGSNPRLGFDTSLTAVNVLADWTTVEGETYDKYKRIGSVEYDSNTITAFTRSDDVYYFDGSLTVTNGSPTSLTAFTCWSPTGISSAVQLYSRMRSSGASNTDLSLRMQDATVSSGDVPVNHLFDNGTNNTAANSFEAITDLNSQVSFRYLSNTNLVSVSIQQRSYTDKRIES